MARGGVEARKRHWRAVATIWRSDQAGLCEGRGAQAPKEQGAFFAVLAQKWSIKKLWPSVLAAKNAKAAKDAIQAPSGALWPFQPVWRSQTHEESVA